MEQITDEDNSFEIEWIETCSRCGSANLDVQEDPNDPYQIWAVCLDCRHESSETTWKLARD